MYRYTHIIYSPTLFAWSGWINKGIPLFIYFNVLFVFKVIFIRKWKNITRNVICEQAYIYIPEKAKRRNGTARIFGHYMRISI